MLTPRALTEIGTKLISVFCLVQGLSTLIYTLTALSLDGGNDKLALTLIVPISQLAGAAAVE